MSIFLPYGSQAVLYKHDGEVILTMSLSFHRVRWASSGCIHEECTRSDHYWNDRRLTGTTMDLSSSLHTPSNWQHDIITFFQIADRCLNQKNFHSVKAIVNAVQSPALQRLQNTWGCFERMYPESFKWVFISVRFKREAKGGKVGGVRNVRLLLWYRSLFIIYLDLFLRCVTEKKTMDKNALWFLEMPQVKNALFILRINVNIKMKCPHIHIISRYSIEHLYKFKRAHRKTPFHWLKMYTCICLVSKYLNLCLHTLPINIPQVCEFCPLPTANHTPSISCLGPI